MVRLAIGLCIILFASANAFYILIPEGKELVYHYRGLIRATTHTPVTYGSSFLLDGQLHVQTDKNSSLIHFSDLKFKLHNGEYEPYTTDLESKNIPLPEDLKAFENPFKVIYEPCGHAMGITVEKDEPQFVVNMKRGVASFMQLATEKLNWETKQPYAFHAKEHTLYGKTSNYYTVFPDTDEWTVKKMAEPRSFYHLFTHINTNSKWGKCDAKYDEPLSRDSNQEYHIIKKDGCHIMDHMESNAGIYYTPYSGEGYNFYVYMNQTMQLEKILDSATPITIKNEKYYMGLTYYTADFANMHTFADIMHGRRKYDMDKMIVDLEEMLCDANKYILEFQLDMKAPDWPRGQLINRILILMLQLDEAHLEEVTAKLMQKTSDEDKQVLNLYYLMLPMIGSHASYMYMIKLIKTKKLKMGLADGLLQNMPYYVKDPNKMLIEHMSEILNFGEDFTLSNRKNAILAFGTFVGKAVSRHRYINNLSTDFKSAPNVNYRDENDITVDPELNEIFPGPKSYEKYVTLLGEKMKSCDDPEMRQTYLNALYNTGMKEAAKYIMPIARGEQFEEDHFLRLLAIKGLGAIISDDEEMIYEVFWPIMSNHQLHTKIRAAAFEQIMNTHPPLQRLNNIFVQLADDPNYTFYQFYYSYLKAIAESTDPCVSVFKNSVKQILAYTTVPEYYSLSRYYALDYMDKKYGHGLQINGMIVHSRDERETTLELHISRVADNAKFHLYGLLIHIDGLEASIFEDVLLNMKNPNHKFNFNFIWQAVKNIPKNKDFRFDITLLNHGQVCGSYHFHHKNADEFANTLIFVVAEKFSVVKKFLTIAYPLQANAIMPTEIGFPAEFKIYMPSVNYYDINLSWNVVNNIITLNCDTHLKKWMHSRIGLSVYNPFVDMYQGVQRQFSYDWAQPLFFDLSLNPTQQSMKLSWKRHDDPQKDTSGMKSYAATFTFFRDDLNNGYLQKSCSKSKQWEMVTFGEEYRKTHILFEEDNLDTGFHHVVAQFDSDRLVLKKAQLNDEYEDSIQNTDNDVYQWILNYIHQSLKRIAPPHAYANGVLDRCEPSKTRQVTNIDINFRLFEEFQRDYMMVTPATKWNMRGTYSVKNKEETLKTWDANIVADVDSGHTTANMKAIFSHTMNGQDDIRLCVDATRKYVAGGIEGEGTVSLSHNTEPTCNKDEKIVEIKFKAEKLPEQLDNKHIYHECEEGMWSDIEGMHSMNCYLARDTLRKWTLDMQSFDMPEKAKKYEGVARNWLQSKYMKYSTDFDETFTPMVKNSIKFVSEYPLHDNVVNMRMYTPEMELGFVGIPTCQHLLHNFRMDTTEHFSSTFMLMHKMGWTELCAVEQNYFYNTTGNMVHYELPQEWTMFLGDAEADAKHGLFMKRLDGDFIAMKMQHDEHCLEIIPTGKKCYDIVIDGKKLDADTYQHNGKWVWVDHIKNTGVISVVCMHTESHIVFDGYTVLIEYPNTDMTYHGRCT